MKNNRWSHIILISLLVCLGLGSLVYFVNQVNHRLIENSNVRVFLQHTADYGQLMLEFSNFEEVVRTTYISSDQAMIDFETTLGYTWPGTNVIPDIIDLTVDPNFSDNFIQELRDIAGVEYLSYSKAAMLEITQLHKLVQQINGVLLLLILLIGSFGLLRPLQIIFEDKRRCVA